MNNVTDLFIDTIHNKTVQAVENGNISNKAIGFTFRNEKTFNVSYEGVYVSMYCISSKATGFEPVFDLNCQIVHNNQTINIEERDTDFAKKMYMTARRRFMENKKTQLVK